MFGILALLPLSALSLGVQGRKVTVANLCKAPVWAAYNGMNSGGITVNGENVGGMWQQASGQEDVLEIPETCKLSSFSTNGFGATGRIWPATGCDDSGTDCMVGGCGTGKCDGALAGQTGATLAEFTFDPSFETYDISIVDGYNVPMAIIPSGGSGDCEHVTCGAETDILTVCDPSLAYPYGGDEVWSCMSPCAAGVEFESDSNGAFDFKTAPVCCPSNDIDQCPTSTIPFYDVYKPLCNRAFLYAPDANGNVVCVGPEYRIEFCPGGKGAGADPSGVQPVAQCAGGEIVGGGVTGTNDDGGGTTGAGLPEGAGQACGSGDSGINTGGSSGDAGGTGSSGSNGDSGTDETGGGSEATGGSAAVGSAGSSQASQPAAGSTEGGAGTADTGAATGAAASGAAAADAAGYWGTTAAENAGATVASGTGGSGTASSAANNAGASAAETPAATTAAAPAGSSTPCRGRECRGQGGGGGRGGGRNRRKRLCPEELRIARRDRLTAK